MTEAGRDWKQDYEEAISLPRLKYPWLRTDSGFENKDEEWVIIRDRLKVGKKGMVRGKGISKMSSLQTRKITFWAEMGKLEKESIERVNIFTIFYCI